MPKETPLLDWESPSARRSDPETSHEAAGDAKPHASYGRMLALQCLAIGPMTDFELAAKTGWQQTSIGKRRGECVKAGLVTVCLDPDNQPVKRETPSGSMARVWRLTDQGRLHLTEVAGSMDAISGFYHVR